MMARPRFTVPQSDRFERQVQVAAVLADIGPDTGAIAHRTGIQPRHVNYAVQALKLLNFVGADGELTFSGRALLKDVRAGKSFIPAYRQAVARSTWVQYLAPNIGTPAFALSRAQLASRIGDLTGFSSATCRRRASTLLSWHRQLLQEQLPLRPPTGPEKAMQIEYLRELGTGAYGQVWQGRDQLDRLVAVKFLLDDVAQYHDLVADARALCRLDHPNVVRVYTVENLTLPSAKAESALAVVMEFVEGSRLSELLENSVVAAAEVERIGMALISGVEAMHAAGVVHDDLHASNVIVSPESVKIIDPYYQDSLAKDTSRTQEARRSKDLTSLKRLLQDLARASTAGAAMWDGVASDFWACDSLEDIRQAWSSYLVTVRTVVEPRPHRGDAIPVPGGRQRSAYSTFVEQLGFDSDPFFHTNAANEDRLHSYFVRPRYFRTLQGDADRLESAVVFAPRGSGKTAQARMLANHAKETGILPVLYEHFPGQTKNTRSIPTLDYHLTNAARTGLATLLSYMDIHGIPFASLGDLHASVGTIAYRLVRALDLDEFRSIHTNPFTAGDSAKSLSREQLRSGRSPGDFLLQRWMAQGLSVQPDSQHTSDGAHAFAVLEAAVHQMRFRGLVVLVDRVDEAPYSNNHAERTYNLVQPILSHMALQGATSSAWKVFLWEQSKQFFSSDARTDRVSVFDLEWKQPDMEAMLSARLAAFSMGKIRNMGQIAAADASDAASLWPIVFAHNSPRSLIRLLQLTVRTELEAGTQPPRITLTGLEGGIREFCEVHSGEVVSDQHLRMLRRLGRTTFTATDLAQALKVRSDNARGKINTMVSAGVVQNVGTIRGSTPGKPPNHYMIREPSVAAYAAAKSSIHRFVDSHMVSCSNCSSNFFTEREARADEFLCPNCDGPIVDPGEE